MASPSIPGATGRKRTRQVWLIAGGVAGVLVVTLLVVLGAAHHVLAAQRYHPADDLCEAVDISPVRSIADSPALSDSPSGSRTRIPSSQVWTSELCDQEWQNDDATDFTVDIMTDVQFCWSSGAAAKVYSRHHMAEVEAADRSLRNPPAPGERSYAVDLGVEGVPVVWVGIQRDNAVIEVKLIIDNGATSRSEALNYADKVARGTLARLSD